MPDIKVHIVDQQLLRQLRDDLSSTVSQLERYLACTIQIGSWSMHPRFYLVSGQLLPNDLLRLKAVVHPSVQDAYGWEAVEHCYIDLLPGQSTTMLKPYQTDDVFSLLRPNPPTPKIDLSVTVKVWLEPSDHKELINGVAHSGEIIDAIPRMRLMSVWDKSRPCRAPFGPQPADFEDCGRLTVTLAWPIDAEPIAVTPQWSTIRGHHALLRLEGCMPAVLSTHLGLPPTSTYYGYLPSNESGFRLHLLELGQPST